MRNRAYRFISICLSNLFFILGIMFLPLSVMSQRGYIPLLSLLKIQITSGRHSFDEFENSDKPLCTLLLINKPHSAECLPVQVLVFVAARITPEKLAAKLTVVHSSRRISSGGLFIQLAMDEHHTLSSLEHRLPLSAHHNKGYGLQEITSSSSSSHRVNRSPVCFSGCFFQRNIRRMEFGF